MLYALASALLWGGTVPFAKRVLDTGVHPLEAAGLLYLGAAIGLTAISLARRSLAPTPALAAPLSRRDLRYLIAAALFGGFAAPWLAMFGQSRTSGMVAALLLNLELPATTAIAVVAYRETVNPRMLFGAALVLGGAVLVATHSVGAGGESTIAGAIAVAGSCVCWGIDNNVTTQVARLDAMRIARWKGAAAAPLSLALAWGLRGAPLWAGAWTGSTIAQMLLIGLVGYGIGLSFIVRAFRELGAARTGALFATAPFVGAIMTIPVLRERPTLAIGAAGALMAAGVALLIHERRA